MSIDLSRYDIYNYEFLLRPDGQTTTETGTTHADLTGVSDNKLKSQYMNIPGQYNVNSKSKVYMYLRDVSISNRDAVDIVIDGSDRRHYLQVQTSSQYNYSNFMGNSEGKNDDSVVQNVQPNFALIPVTFQPIVRDYSILPIEHTTDSTRAGFEVLSNMSSDIPGSMYLKDDYTYPILPIDPAHNKASELGTLPWEKFHVLSPAGADSGTDPEIPAEPPTAPAYINVPVWFQQVAENPVTFESAHSIITDIGSRKCIMGMTIDKSTGMLDRMVCINNPFGNQLEFHIQTINPTMGLPDTLDGKTRYDLQASTLKMGGAVVISFSLLVEKDKSAEY